jgi:SH3 domain-containing protein
MVEYVYARHDFIPEHEDEVSFRAGERIEVVEKDDLYNDGWWQVSSLSSLSLRIQYPLPSLESPLSALAPHGFLEACSVLGFYVFFALSRLSCQSHQCRWALGPCLDEPQSHP